jgi:hypothetical protein
MIGRKFPFFRSISKNILIIANTERQNSFGPVLEGESRDSDWLQAG